MRCLERMYARSTNGADERFFGQRAKAAQTRLIFKSCLFGNKLKWGTKLSTKYDISYMPIFFFEFIYEIIGICL